MSQTDIFSQFKNMDPKARENLLNQVMGALSPEQKEMVQNIASDKKKMEKVEKNLQGEDLSAILSQLAGKGNPSDFLQNPKIQKKIQDLLR